ncbi:hypothetical protein TNCV_1374951 [Trichonephila clavipes]|nr:hypothetical protein TNCV_1374951 [Trichonephila clavipes]
MRAKVYCAQLSIRDLEPCGARPNADTESPLLSPQASLVLIYRPAEGMKDNMLTKYQMIKFIDFCEVWFLPESVARVAAIVGDHRCQTTRH